MDVGETIKDSLAILVTGAVAGIALLKATDTYIVIIAIAGIAGIAGFQIFSALKPPPTP